MDTRNHTVIGHEAVISAYERAVEANNGKTMREGRELPEWLPLHKLPILTCRWRLKAQSPGTPLHRAYSLLYQMRTLPNACFSTLSVPTKDLLTCLTLTRSFLAGSRALDFFSPGVVASDSDWDFYCIGTIEQYHILLRCMTYFGFEFTNPPSSNHYSNLYVCTGVIDNQKVQLIWDCESSTPMETVARFHSTILSCYVSGVNAVCLQPHLVAEHVSAKRFAGPKDSRRHYVTSWAWSKYATRGVSYVEADGYFDRALSTIGHKKDNERMMLMAYSAWNSTNPAWVEGPGTSGGVYPPRLSRSLMEIVFPCGSWREDTTALRLERKRMLEHIDDPVIDTVCIERPECEQSSQDVPCDQVQVKSTDLRVETRVLCTPSPHVCKNVPVPKSMSNEFTTKEFTVRMKDTPALLGDGLVWLKRLEEDVRTTTSGQLRVGKLCETCLSIMDIK